MEHSGWLRWERGKYALSERGGLLLRVSADEVLGMLYLESLYSRAVKLNLGEWEKCLEALRGC